MKEIVAFYHMATMGHYREVNAELLGLLKHSGLLHKCKSVKIGVVGTGEIDLLYEHPKFDIKRLHKVVDAKDCFQYPTQRWMREYAEHNDSYLFYFVNAGVSHKKDRKDYYPGWREMDSHFCIMQHERCIKELENGYDIVSAEWQTDPCPHFSGSFWWTHSAFLRTLPSWEEAQVYAHSLVGTLRHGSEFWIGMNKKVKYKSLYQTGYSWRNRPIKNYFDDAVKKEGWVDR